MKENFDEYATQNGRQAEAPLSSTYNGDESRAMENPADGVGAECSAAEKAVQNKTFQRKEKFFTAKNMTKLAMFTALSYILYLFIKFPLPFIFPSFLDFQISDMPALLAGFSIGPMGGVVVIVLKCLLKMPFSGTACVGEIADILIGCAFVLPAALIYKKHRTQKGALVGLTVGAAASVVMSLLANAFISIPFYVEFMFHGNWEILLNMVRNLFPAITKDTFYLYYLPLSILPFNILRCALSYTVTLALYKKLAKLFDLMWEGRKSKSKLLDK